MTRERFAPFAWGVFGYSLLVILWGYFLRISESGDGCGTDWPLCHGQVIPGEAALPTWVEFIHRASSGLVLVLVLLMLVWAFRAYPRGHAVRKGAGIALLFTVTESLFGAMLVVFGWVATDISGARIILRPFHVTNTFLLMAALALTPFWASRRTSRLPPLRAPAARYLWPSVLGVLALAWTGSWTGLATTAFPADSVAQGLGQYVDGEHLLIYLRVLHPLVAVAVVGVVLWTVRGVRRGGSDPLLDRLGPAVAGVALAQLAVGPVTVLLLNPTWSRLLHLLLADLLWIGLILMGAAALAETRDPPSGRPSAEERAPATPGRTRRPARAP